MDRFREKQNCRCGIGGIRCPCCNGYKGAHKYKRKLNQLARKALKEELKKEVHNGFAELS